MPGTYTGYVKGIQARSGKNPEDFWKAAEQKGLVKNEKIMAKYAELLGWLKTEMGLGHVHANMIIAYFRLRTDDPALTDNMKKWAYSTGYQPEKKADR
ncbi:MAG: DUF4287 domain-containing protein [Dehalococcoidales bacterium]|jgi:hypothetical protein